MLLSLALKSLAMRYPALLFPTLPSQCSPLGPRFPNCSQLYVPQFRQYRCIELSPCDCPRPEECQCCRQSDCCPCCRLHQTRRIYLLPMRLRRNCPITIQGQNAFRTGLLRGLFRSIPFRRAALDSQTSFRATCLSNPV